MYMHLVWNTAMNGMTCSVAIVIPTRVRKVKEEDVNHCVLHLIRRPKQSIIT